ncbi:hypothetical protein SAMN05216198_0868 [Halopseudomonas litoralis]|uniref:Uncharacterized protein n=1 Tax=Halopseudomonas litoralis TaxID=797277 RepID=A0A1H1NC87_9GAMM|nr:hypothetical protein SAMN05216198_0868 [Halopseudomonas litoralis]
MNAPASLSLHLFNKKRESYGSRFYYNHLPQ